MTQPEEALSPSTLRYQYGLVGTQGAPEKKKIKHTKMIVNALKIVIQTTAHKSTPGPV